MKSLAMFLAGAHLVALPAAAQEQTEADAAVAEALRVLLDERGIKYRSVDAWDSGSGRGIDLSGTEISSLARLEGTGVTRLKLENTGISDLTPLGRIDSLRELDLGNTDVADITPLSGLAGLRQLTLSGSRVVDLSPLKGLSLNTVHLERTVVADLSPLRAMPVWSLFLGDTPVSNIAPLKGLPLKTLELDGTGIRDLSPLSESQTLQELDIARTPVTDLSPLKGVKNLKALHVGGGELSDLSGLEGVQLERLALDPSEIRSGMQVIRDMKSLKTIAVVQSGRHAVEEWTAPDFWVRYDRGEFRR